MHNELNPPLKILGGEIEGQAGENATSDKNGGFAIRH